MRRKVALFLSGTMMALCALFAGVTIAPSSAAATPTASLKKAGFVKIGTVTRAGSCKKDGTSVTASATWEKWQQKKTGKIRFLRIRFHTEASRQKGDDFAHLEVWATSGPSTMDGSPDKVMNFALEGSAVTASTQAAFLAAFYRYDKWGEVKVIVCEAIF